MGRDLGRLLAAAAWWLLKLLATMLLGGLLVGSGGLVLGLLPGGVDTLWGLEIGALVGAGFGAFVAFGPGFATWGLGEGATRDVPTDREGETPEGADYSQNLHQDRR
jgi:hypothetical protein